VASPQKKDITPCRLNEWLIRSQHIKPLVPDCSKMPSNEAAGEWKPEAYPQGYVEDFDEPRTKIGKRRVLARRGWAGGIWAFFGSLLHVEAEVDNIRFFDDVIFAFEAKQPLLLHLCL
jgi:hypothetical protein